MEPIRIAFLNVKYKIHRHSLEQSAYDFMDISVSEKLDWRGVIGHLFWSVERSAL